MKMLGYVALAGLLCSLSPGQPPKEESFFLRRIQEYWKEGSFEIAKRQIRSYLEQYPDSQVRDELHMLLGDLYSQEKNFIEALSQYCEIKKTALKEKIIYNQILCFFEMKRFSELVQIAALNHNNPAFSPEQQESVRYLYATSLYELAKTESDAKEKQSLLQKSLDAYTLCKTTSYEAASLLPLAYIHKMLGNDHNACSCFLSLASANTKHKEDYLFEAALLQAKFSKESAIKTFEQIIHLKASRASDAAYNYLVLLFQEKKYKDVVLHYEEVRNCIDESYMPTIQYTLGKSLFALQDYALAASYLMKSLDRSALTSESRKEIGMLALECSYKTKDLALFEKIVSEFSFAFQEPSERCRIQLAHAELLKCAGKEQEYLDELSQFISDYPNHTAREELLLELGQLAYETKRWLDAERYLTHYIATYPAGKSLAAVWRMRLNAAQERLTHSQAEALVVNRVHLVALLKDALSKPGILQTPQETSEAAYELAKNLHLLGNYVETLQEIGRFNSLQPTSSHKQQLAFIQADCYLHLPDQTSSFISLAEQLLLEPLANEDRLSLHLHLYNAYLTASQSVEAKDPQAGLIHAADHLFSAYTLQPSSLKKDNVQWLADFYYDQSTMAQDTLFHQRASHLLENLVQSHMEVAPENGETESNLYKLCQLLTKDKKWQPKMALLEKWLSERHPTAAENMAVSPQLHNQLIFELALSYAVLGAKDKALQLYDLLIRSHTSSPLAGGLALLERSKIQYSLLADSDKTEDNPLYMQVLNDLKDIEIRKRLSAEPVHLEAALEYIRYRSDLWKDPREKKEKQLHLLRLVKDSFASEPDDIKETIQNGTAAHKNKQRIQALYLSFIDAEIARLQVPLSPEALSHIRKELSNLENNPSLPASLKARIAISQAELNQ